ncbi:two-component system sensor histidine kinase NtrB [Zavarzinia sp. CC-PAN008]|uniref:two-component system sensor histidine kinase NtrB n=1 Tax=Zavarzinia sp. CC-PAN008 TaxID=3243332 RepID=UPI003F74503A
MGRALPKPASPFALAVPDPDILFNALPDPHLVLDPAGRIIQVNTAAEHFFASGAGILMRRRLSDLVPFDSPLLALVTQVRAQGVSMSEHEVELDPARQGSRPVDIEVVSITELPGHLLVALREQTIARTIDRQMVSRAAARSVSGMAAVLAHEVKNPLSGIRGAAQLLEENASETDRDLTRLICEETDRICALVDRMEVFTDRRPMERDAVNIHQVLEHVRRVAQTGFARRVRFVEQYDPSLPPVHGDRNALVQVFLNLVKNAAEALEDMNGTGEIMLTTAYRHGVRVQVPGTRKRLKLPLEVTVRDNGPGISADLRTQMFEPFVTTKATGTGLGLALVAKIIGDHGGIVECESEPRRTVFRVLLPMAGS